MYIWALSLRISSPGVQLGGDVCTTFGCTLAIVSLSGLGCLSEGMWVYRKLHQTLVLFRLLILFL